MPEASILSRNFAGSCGVKTLHAPGGGGAGLVGSRKPGASFQVVKKNPPPPNEGILGEGGGARGGGGQTYRFAPPPNNLDNLKNSWYVMQE